MCSMAVVVATANISVTTVNGSRAKSVIEKFCCVIESTLNASTIDSNNFT